MDLQEVASAREEDPALGFQAGAEVQVGGPVALEIEGTDQAHLGRMAVQAVAFEVL